jgi:outer membrane protein TolC
MSVLKFICASLLLITASNAVAQPATLTIEQCYELAKQNYPLIKKHGLIAASSSYSVANAGKLYLPQFSVNGQATYQSQTINFAEALPAMPGVNLPNISKDQYKIQAEISQQLYDGGGTKNQQEMIRANEAIQQQSLEVSLYAIKDRITQLYFSILMMDDQLKQNDIKKSTLKSAVDKAVASLQNGTVFRSNVDELQAEVASTDMSDIEFRSNRSAYIEMLCLFIGRKPDENMQLIVPDQQINDPAIRRPELILYDLQKKIYDIQEQQLKSDHLPKLNAFAQGAYGRPTLNIIENKFGPWWIGGLRLNWSLGSLYTLKNNRSILKMNRDNVDVDEETFLFNTNLSRSQENGEVRKYLSLIRQDDTVISLRASVTRAAQAQLDNGVITVHDYISKLNAETLARQIKTVHTTLLLQAQYDYKNTTGN